MTPKEKELVESFVFQYAEENGLLLGKEDIENFNEWIEENVN